jgi:hypothetical protein
MLPLLDACIGSTADDTIFSPRWATRLGIELGSAPRELAQVVGGSVIGLFFAPVTLLLSDGQETCKWPDLPCWSCAAPGMIQERRKP